MYKISIKLPQSPDWIVRWELDSGTGLTNTQIGTEGRIEFFLDARHWHLTLCDPSAL